MKKLLVLLLLFAPALRAQVPVALSPTPRMQFFSEVTPSVPLAGGKVCTFNAGTTTPAATYTDISGTFQNTNPIVLDGSGFATIYLANQEYKFIVYDSTGNNACPNTGVQQWSQDNVSAFQPVVGTQTIIFAGVTSDPTGQAGMMDYRTDLGKFRGFNTAWDSFVMENVAATLTNKTLTAPMVTNPTTTGTDTGTETLVNKSLTSPSINGTMVTGPPATYLVLTNDVTTGTTLNTLTKMLGATAVIASTTDTGGIIGICVAGCGKTGSATIQQNGSVSCVADGSFTAGDYLQNSATVGGNCHDVGANYPSNGQVVGRAQLTSAGAGTYASVLFGPEIKPVPQTVAVANLTAQGANISSTPMFTPAANGFYRFSCYVVITQAATTSSTLPSCNVQYTDGDSSVSENVLVTGINTTNAVGTAATVGSLNQIPIFVKTGVSVSYSTVGYVTSGATPLQYAIHVRLEGPL